MYHNDRRLTTKASCSRALVSDKRRNAKIENKQSEDIAFRAQRTQSLHGSLFFYIFIIICGPTETSAMRSK